MHERIPAGTLWRIRLSSITWFLLLTGFLLGLPVVLAWPLLLATIAGVSLLIALLLTASLKLMRRRSTMPLLPAITKSGLVLFLGTVTLAGLPVYYLSFEVETHPSALPLVTLSNGSKTVVYQGMVHVGSENFYKSVVYDLEKALSDGYTLFYEGVQPSPGEGDQWFRDYITGGGDLSENYKLLGSVCGLQFQLEYFKLLVPDMTAHPGRHLTVDVSTLDMKREFDRLGKADPAFAAAAQKKPAGSNSLQGENGLLGRLIGSPESGTPEQKAILGILCRGAINASMGGPGRNDALSPVVLDFRNRHLAKQIVSHPATKIYVTYGAAHLPGVLALLKGQDPKWQVVSTKWTRAVGTPEKLTGTLPAAKAP